MSKAILVTILILGLLYSVEAQQSTKFAEPPGVTVSVIPTHVITYVYAGQTTPVRTLVENNIFGKSSVTYAQAEAPKSAKVRAIEAENP